jgi:hypothetical protein
MHKPRPPLDIPPGLPNQQGFYAHAVRGCIFLVQFLFGIVGAIALMTQLPKIGPLIHCNFLSGLGDALTHIFASLVYDLFAYFHIDLGKRVSIALVALIMISIAKSAVDRQIEFFKSDRELEIEDRLTEYFGEKTLREANPKLFRIAAEFIAVVHETFFFSIGTSRFDRSLENRAFGEAMVATEQLFVRNAPTGVDTELLRFLRAELAIEFPWGARLLFLLKWFLLYVSVAVVFLPFFDFMVQYQENHPG